MYRDVSLSCLLPRTQLGGRNVPRLCGKRTARTAICCKYFYLFMYLLKCDYSIHSKFTMQQAGQRGGFAALMSALNLD